MKISRFKTNTSDLDSLGELPATYGLDSIVLIAQEPHRLFSYWDIDISMHPGGQTLIRVYKGGDCVEAEMEATFEGRHIYIPVQSAGETYSIEIGYYRRNVWNPIARSNPVTTPRDTLSDLMEFDWATIPHDVCLPLLQSTLKKNAEQGETLVQTLGRLQRNDLAIASLLTGFLKSCLADVAQSSQGTRFDSFSSDSSLLRFGESSMSPAALSSWLQAATSSWMQSGQTSRSSAALSSWLQAGTSSSMQAGQTSWSSAALSSWLQAVTSSSMQAGQTSWSSAALSSWLQAVTSSSMQAGQTSWSSAALSSWLQAVTSSSMQAGETSWSSAALSSWLQAVTSSSMQAGQTSWTSAALSSWLQAVNSSWLESSYLNRTWQGGISWNSANLSLWGSFSGHALSSETLGSFGFNPQNAFGSELLPCAA
ncbi:MAG: DUF4912 domain-containing protein [Terrimicrobiaceae bacterium]